MNLGATEGEPRGRWQQAAAILVMLGGFADASLAHPDRLDPLDMLLFASALASVLLFLSLSFISWWRILLIGSTSVVSAVSVVLDAARGVTRVELAIGVVDVALRLALVAILAGLAVRHLGSPGRRQQGARETRP